MMENILAKRLLDLSESELTSILRILMLKNPDAFSELKELVDDT